MLRKGTYVTAPFAATGAGMLVFFATPQKKVENIAFRHHMRFERTYLALDGCLMAQWQEGDSVTCAVWTRDLEAEAGKDSSSSE